MTKQQYLDAYSLYQEIKTLESKITRTNFIDPFMLEFLDKEFVLEINKKIDNHVKEKINKIQKKLEEL